MAFSINNSTRGRRREVKAEINVTPLVDVMLVLLVIFMVTSPMLIAGINVDLPSGKASAIGGSDEPIAVTVDRSGAVYIQETKIKASELSEKLEAILHNKKETRIFVRGDRNVDYGKVMEVFGAIKNAGFSNVALVWQIE